MNSRQQLISAIQAADLDHLEELLTEGCDPNAFDVEGRTALMLAAESGDPDLVCALIDAGADLERGFVDLDESTSFTDRVLTPHDAAELVHQYFDSVYDSIDKVLGEIQSKENYEQALEAHSFRCSTPLQLAIEDGNREIVELLISAGARLCFENLIDDQPLNRAIALGQFEIAAQLIRAGAFEIEFFADNPLVIAARMGSCELVELLLNAGALIDEPDATEETALYAAEKAGQTDIVRLLKARGAKKSHTRAMSVADTRPQEQARAA